MSRNLLLLSALSAVACRKVEPAPADLDGLFHYYWNGMGDIGDGAASEDPDLAAGLDDEALRAAFDNSLAVVGEPDVNDPLRGSVSRLSADEVAAFGRDDVDVADAAGFYLVTSFDCTADELEAIYAWLAQDELYEGAYDAYTRSYTTDADAYFARTTPTVAWEVELQSSLIGASFTEWLNGGLRRVPGDDGHGDAVLGRTWMPRAAAFEEGSNKVFDQDYQIEVFYEHQPGRLLHLYALWRHVDMGGLTSDDDAVVNIIINNLVDWDKGTAQLCAEGRP